MFYQRFFFSFLACAVPWTGNMCELSGSVYYHMWQHSSNLHSNHLRARKYRQSTRIPRAGAVNQEKSLSYICQNKLSYWSGESFQRYDWLVTTTWLSTWVWCVPLKLMCWPKNLFVNCSRKCRFFVWSKMSPPAYTSVYTFQQPQLNHTIVLKSPNPKLLSSFIGNSLV